MPFDYKKEYKEFYLPPQKPQLLEVPPMNYVAVRGHGAVSYTHLDMILMPVWLSTGLMPSSVPMAGP